MFQVYPIVPLWSEYVTTTNLHVGEKKIIRYPTNIFYRNILSFLISDKINTSAVSLVSPDIHDSQDSQDSRDSQKFRLSRVLGQLDIVSLVSQQL